MRLPLSKAALSVLASLTNGVGHTFSVYSFASRAALSSIDSVQDAMQMMAIKLNMIFFIFSFVVFADFSALVYALLLQSYSKYLEEPNF